MVQVATCQDNYHNGWTMYRHSATDETKAARPGEELPSEEEYARRKDGSWEALADDNLDRNGRALTFIELIDAASGPIIEFDAGFIAEVGMTINLRGEVGPPDLKKGGLYHINRAVIAKRKGDDASHICVHRIGDIDPKKFIYELRFA